MHNFQSRLLCVLCIGQALLSTVFVDAARATLGEPTSSLESNRTVLRAEQKSTTKRSTYTIHEDASDGARVRQYSSSSGIVFAIAWNGISHPDLVSLLGNYYEEYYLLLRSAAHKPGRRHIQLQGSRVVVEKWGHMRNLQGRAYAPALLPSGVSINEIR